MSYGFHVAAPDDLKEMAKDLAIEKANELLPKGEKGQEEAARIVNDIMNYLTKTQGGKSAPRPETVPEGLDPNSLVHFTQTLKRRIPSAFPGERTRRSSTLEKIADKIALNPKPSQRK